MEGRYSVPEPGMYYLEIIVLFCNISLEDDDTDTTHQDFTNIVVEDPWRHRITQDGATINVTSTTTVGGGGGGGGANNTATGVRPAAAAAAAGYYYWKEQSSLPPPLYTRFQPPGCRDAVNATQSWCAGPMNLTRFHGYEFRWTTNPTTTPQVQVPGAAGVRQQLPSSTKQQQDNFLICTIGASHSYLMARLMNRVFRKRVCFHNGTVKFPYNLRANLLRLYSQTAADTNKNCTDFVVGIGQHPASFALGRPMLVSEYAANMTFELKSIQSLVAKQQQQLGAPARLFVRSMNYNPLGDMKLFHPPTDWRTPPVVDAYNAALQTIAIALGIPYIDSSTTIIEPMWDSAPDWCHYRNAAGLAHAEYVGRFIMNYKN